MKRIITSSAEDTSVERLQDDLDIALAKMMDTASFLAKHSNEIPKNKIKYTLQRIEEFNDSLDRLKHYTVAGRPKRRLEGTLYE